MMDRIVWEVGLVGPDRSNDKSDNGSVCLDGITESVRLAGPVWLKGLIEWLYDRKCRRAREEGLDGLDE